MIFQNWNPYKKSSSCLPPTFNDGRKIKSHIQILKSISLRGILNTDFYYYVSAFDSLFATQNRKILLFMVEAVRFSPTRCSVRESADAAKNRVGTIWNGKTDFQKDKNGFIADFRTAPRPLCWR